MSLDRTKRSCAVALLACGVALTTQRGAWSSRAVAQAEPEVTTEPPLLVEPREPAYPAGVELTEPIQLDLRITLSADGTVTAAEVLSSAGDALDRVALEVVRSSKWRPALRRGEPVASRFVFRLELAPSPVQPTQTAAEPGPAPAARAARAPAPTVEVRRSVDVQVRGDSRRSERRRREPYPVDVVDMSDAQQQAADVGEVLARTQGVSVQRSGGLGSDTQLSLNGLGQERVRVFLDGVPLDLSGYPLGLTNVPPNLIDSIAIYRGVVPIALGADALGGAIDLISEGSLRDTRAAASYQAGSFGTHRATALASHFAPRLGLFARADGFFDRSDNDYLIEQQVPDDRGRNETRSVRRFHDGYRALGAHLELGVLGRGLDRLSVRAFFTDLERDVQHGLTPLQPYGEVEFGRRSAGAQLTLAHSLSDTLHLRVLAGYNYLRTTLRDLGTCRYTWLGRCVAMLPQPGEIQAQALDQTIGQHAVHARLTSEWSLSARHNLRIAFSPRHYRQQGQNAALQPGAFDALSARRTLTTGVLGLEYTFGEHAALLNNIAALKLYGQWLRTVETLPNGRPRDLTLNTIRPGFAESVVLHLGRALETKASYEYAIRLPNPTEMFGDGGFIESNLHIQPERSHNANLGLYVTPAAGPLGAWMWSIDGFARLTRDLIVLLPAAAYATYQNVRDATIVGVESSARYTTPGRWLSVELNGTYQDARNRSRSGEFSELRGQRIPNQPYMFANAAVRVRVPPGLLPEDELALKFHSRYTRAFYLGWQAYGRAVSKLQVEDQLIHSLALSYQTRGRYACSGSLELHNLFDARNFDNYGVQRAGRALYVKLTVEI